MNFILYNNYKHLFAFRQANMRKFSVFTFLSVMALSSCCSETNVRVAVKEGTLEGSLNNLLNGGIYFSFKGIPYAQPPIGDLRFMDPLPPKPWSGIYDATKHGAVCTQFDILTNKIIQGSEDCLFLNIYTNSLNPNSKLPVMVFIHGGGFISGSGNTDFYGPEFLLQHDVIVVTINYRLEVLGFLSLDTPEVPGNAGLKDQVAALRWVKNNIAQFGGDPDNVTIFGESAGSAAVTYHLISPMSKGLFHKVIAQSGTCIDDWAIGRFSIDRAFRASKVLGNESENIDELLTFLRSVPAVDLAGMTYKTRTAEEESADFAMFFDPVVEKKIDGVESFLNEEPLDILVKGKTNKVPLMLGYNSIEGLMLVIGNRIYDKNNDAKYLVPRELRQKLNVDKTKEMGERIKKFYVGNEDFSNDTVVPFINMVTDTNFLYNMNRFATIYSATKQPVFAYRLNYSTDLNFAKKFFSIPGMKGATHADDLFYLFYNAAIDGPYTNQTKLQDIVFNLTKMWTDFAKTGNPTPDNHHGVTWKPYSPNRKIMKLEDPISFGSNPDNNRLKFWNDLYCEANVPHINMNTNLRVTVKEGILEGSLNNLLNGGKYFSFKGIPYAQPPIGDLRFKDPLPPKPWGGIYDATKHGAVCTQFDILTNKIIQGSEDCLFLNVYTNSLNPRSKLPVMVFIHGGGFMSGSGNTDFYGPEFLLQHNVIVVTINYRLEVLGFLSLDTPEVPGNAGLKDQVAALRWVKNNIAQFGGDPDNVTIFGESAGSAAVTYHLISPMSKGLFHKVIAQSGTCIDDWAIGRFSIDRAFRTSKVLGNESENIDELLTFLQSVPAVDLAGMTYKTRTAEEESADFAMFFDPVVEKKIDGVESFLNEEPLDILVKGKTNKVPLMLGYNSIEGLMMVIGNRIYDKNNDAKYLVPRELRQKLNVDKTKEMGERIKKFYVGNEDFSNDTVVPYINMVTDTNFLYNMNRFATFYSAAKQPVFAYRFNYNTDLNFAKKLFGIPGMKGATHADELFYLFYNAAIDGPYKSQMKLQNIVFNLTKMWTDFAKTGNPTPDNHHGITWKHYSPSRKFMKLEDPISLGANPDNSRLKFWNDLYCEADAPHIPMYKHINHK